jgi:dodecin
MSESVYKVIELIGSSAESWEKAAENAITTAAKTIEDIRIAEVVETDLVVEDGKVKAYRTKLQVSFKIHEHAKEHPA